MVVRRQLDQLDMAANEEWISEPGHLAKQTAGSFFGGFRTPAPVPVPLPRGRHPEPYTTARFSRASLALPLCPNERTFNQVGRHDRVVP